MRNRNCSLLEAYTWARSTFFIQHRLLQWSPSTKSQCWDASPCCANNTVWHRSMLEGCSLKFGEHNSFKPGTDLSSPNSFYCAINAEFILFFLNLYLTRCLDKAINLILMLMPRNINNTLQSAESWLVFALVLQRLVDLSNSKLIDWWF